MKKFAIVILAVALMISFYGCKSEPDKSTNLPEGSDESNKELIQKTFTRI